MHFQALRAEERALFLSARRARKCNRCARHGNELEGESPLLARRGEQLAEGKGVHREVESEGSWRQNAALMNKKRIRRTWRISRPVTTKSNTLTESTDVDPTGISGKVQ